MTIHPRPAIEALTAYDAPLEGRQGKIRLDFNENTVGFPEACDGLPPDLLTAYPEYDAFYEALERWSGLSRPMLLPVNGSSEGLFLAPFVFIRPGQDSALISSPTFPVIAHMLHLTEANIDDVPRRPNLDYDIDALTDALARGPKLCILATPDNPTGAIIPQKALRRWLSDFPDTLFVIDEAYTEYTGTTILPWVREFENLLVLRSFSKAWGLAGARLGLIAGHPQLISWLRCAKSPYSVNAPAMRMASRLLAQSATVEASAQATMARKPAFIKTLRARGYTVVPGHAHFVLIYIGLLAQQFCSFCRERGVLVRDRSAYPSLEGFVRVNMGTEAEVETFLGVLHDFRQQAVLLLDLDDTLVDTSRSYDTAVCRVVSTWRGGNDEPSKSSSTPPVIGKPCTREDLLALRAEGGFNDDWEAAQELLRRQDIEATLEAVTAAGKPIYLSLALAPDQALEQTQETWLMSPKILAQLSKICRVAVVTGRPRDEYAPVWQSRLDPLVERVFCCDDLTMPNGSPLPKKPAPDTLTAALAELGATQGAYIGNNVDDMRAAAAAGLMPIGVASTHSAETLTAAGAERIVDMRMLMSPTVSAPQQDAAVSL